MSFKTLMTLSAMALVSIGLGVFIGPPGFDLFYGAVPSPPTAGSPGADPVYVGIAFMRLFGVMLAGLGIVAWAVRGLTNSDAQEAVARGIQYAAALGGLMALAQEIAVFASAAGALLVALFVVLVLAITYWRVHHARADPYGVVSVRV